MVELLCLGTRGRTWREVETNVGDLVTKVIVQNFDDFYTERNL